MNKRMDEFMKGFPFDEMIDTMVPIYQKHLTRGDVDTLIAFYSTPTGQKLLKEMPEISAETMQIMMPKLRKRMDTVNQRVHEEATARLKESPAKSGQSAPQENK